MTRIHPKSFGLPSPIQIIIAYSVTLLHRRKSVPVPITAAVFEREAPAK